MEGFFTLEQTQSRSRPNGKLISCASCGLSTNCLSPKIPPFGKFKKGIMILGEAPSETEDRAGQPWRGKAGRLLEKTLANLGVDLFEDCVSINSCNCRPPDNRTPSNHEVDCCRSSLLKAIEEYMPKVIIPLGNTAIYSLIGHRWKKELEGINKWRGWSIPDQDLKAWVCPTYHPSFVMRGGIEDAPETIWIQDLEQAVSMTEVPFLKYKKPVIDVIEDLSVLLDIKADLISFDYETTGIKPHADGHRIVCASVADSPDHVYVFMMPNSKKEREPFAIILGIPWIGKMAHNMKFEDTWSVIRLKTEVYGWQWDSMLAAHVLDNRTGVTGLKFQTYVQFGVIDYDSEISPFLHSNGKSGNSLNTVMELIKTKEGRDKLLHYCALDSIFEYRLAMKQMKQMDYSFLPF